MEEKNRVVHLPHPGVEHIIKFNKENFSEEMEMDGRKYNALIVENQRKNSDTVFPWNRGDHRRKYICNEGKYVESVDEELMKEDVELYFWGEWEQPSKVTAILNKGKVNKDFPSFIHKPLLGRLDDSIENMYERYNSKNDPNIGNHNTDPYVFGSQFYYSCCRQNGQMKELKEGDIIIFYSGNENNGKTVQLDTVFVVGGRCLEYGKDKNGIYIDDLAGNRYYNDEIKEHISISDAYLNGVLNAIWFGRNAKETDEFHNILYFGATYEKKVNGMFSYFICKTKDEGAQGFPRVSYKAENVDDNEFGFSYLLQKQKFVVTKIPILDYTKCDNTYDYWLKLTKDILKKKYKLGVYAKEPDKTI